LNVHTRKGLSTTTGVAIIIVLLVVAGGAYYFLTTQTSNNTTTTTTTTSTAGPLPGKGLSIGLVFDVGGLGDRGFNDLAYQGMLKANQTLGVNYDYRVASTSSDFPNLFNALMAEHMTLIVGNGFDMDTVINDSATRNPTQLYAQVDGDWPNFNHTNVIVMKWQEHIGSAIVGALSVSMTKTDKIGFLGGVATGIIYKFWNGWKAGAVWASSYLHKNVTLLKQYAGTTFDYFDKPSAGYSIGQTMISQGADIIFTAAGGTGIGTFNAIGQYDAQQGWNYTTTTPPPVFGIGVDANQDYYGTYQYFVQHHNQSGATLTPPSFILTSEIKTVDKGVFDVMKAVVYHNFSAVYDNPTKFGPSFYSGLAQVCGADYSSPCHARGVWEFGLDTGSVGPTNFQYTSMYLTPAANNILKQITNGILNGTIHIPEDYSHA
jgi:basic membrane protein A and related proteins